MAECRNNCGSCRNHRYDPEYQDYYCTEVDSEYYGEFTDYADTCDEFFERANL